MEKGELEEAYHKLEIISTKDVLQKLHINEIILEDEIQEKLVLKNELKIQKHKNEHYTKVIMKLQE
jgi:hypothetical protein